jgi:hypothetical protein
MTMQKIGAPVGQLDEVEPVTRGGTTRGLERVQHFLVEYAVLA